jgi:hypothetical protein
MANEFHDAKGPQTNFCGLQTGANRQQRQQQQQVHAVVGAMHTITGI